MPADIRAIGRLMRAHDARGFRDPIRWGPGWSDGPFLGFANRLHGDALPTWFDPSPYTAYRTQFWQSFNPWFVVVGEENPANPYATLHGSTNTRVQTRNMRTYLRRSNAPWTLFSEVPAPTSDLFAYDWTSFNGQYGGWRSEASNGGGTSHKLSNDARTIPHGYGNPQDIPDPGSVIGIAVELEHRLILDNAGGTDDRSLARCLICVASDLYPFIGAPLPNVGYWPANGAGGFMRVTSDWQTIGFTTYFAGAVPNIQAPGIATLDTTSLLLADPPPGWFDGNATGGGGGSGGVGPGRPTLLAVFPQMTDGALTIAPASDVPVITQPPTVAPPEVVPPTVTRRIPSTQQVQMVPPTVPIVDDTGNVHREWYRFFAAMFRDSTIGQDMAQTKRRLVSAVLPATPTALYTCPDNTRTTITAAVLTNVGTAAVSVSLFLVPRGESAATQYIVLPGASIAAGASRVVPELVDQVIEPGGSIVAFGVGATLVVTGVEQT